MEHWRRPDRHRRARKTALKTRKAPVLVIYNHFGYWHAVYVMGFDDEADSEHCSFVERSRKHYVTSVENIRKELDNTTDPYAREKLEKRLAKAERTTSAMEAAWQRGGGCAGKGVFYVRDSIYEDQDGPVYDYDPSRRGDEAPYSSSVILHEYEWLKYLSNHVVQPYVATSGYSSIAACLTMTC